jgi:DNA-binding transcriptional regulator GbsR (MarR family)
MTAGDQRAGVAEKTAAILAVFGFPSMPARVLMSLVVSDTGAMTAAELADSLSVSPAAISGATRYLRLIGFVQQTTIPGTRKHRYDLTEHAWYEASMTQPDRYRMMTRVMEEGMKDLPAGQGRARLAEMVDFFSFLERRLPDLLVEWNEGRNPDRPRAR